MRSEGCIFDIQRFSTHDGSGIRTTVFLKGCPLSCAWCQNPEGIRAAREPVLMDTPCIGCGSCTENAKSGGVYLDTQKRLQIDPGAEEDWQQLMELCPSGALRWCGQKMTVPQVLEEVRKDLPFYRHGGGGVTLSGGDPIQQADFASEFLRRCREEGIHTALETEAAMPWQEIEKVLPFTDLLYADLKLADPVEALRYTGRSSARILTNVRRLLAGPWAEKITIRTPLIPGITARRKNILALARFLASCKPDVPWELLNYNALAPAKYPLVHRTYPLADDLQPFSAEEMDEFVRSAAAAGAAGVYWDRGERISTTPA